MNPLKMKSFDVYIAALIVYKNNGSLSCNLHRRRCNELNWEHLLFGFATGAAIPTIEGEKGSKHTCLLGTILDRAVVDIAGYMYLTCYNKEQLSFRFYLNPFQPSAWVAILTCPLIMSIMVISYVKYNIKCSVNVASLFLFIVSFLFERGYFIQKRLEKETSFLLFIAGWILLSVIFTNSYLSITIRTLNSPLEYLTIKYPGITFQVSKEEKFIRPILSKTQNSVITGGMKTITQFVESGIYAFLKGNSAYMSHPSRLKETEKFGEL